MTRNNKILLVIILVIFAFTLCVVFPISKGVLVHRGMRLGLDLVGGVDLVYQAQFSANATAADKSAAMDRAILTIQKRIDTYGVTEPIIQKLGNNRIMVQLPGFTDIDAAKALVEQTGFLEFREAENERHDTSSLLKTTSTQPQYQFIDAAETGTRLFTVSANDSKGNPTYQTVAILTDDNGVYKLDRCLPAMSRTIPRSRNTAAPLPGFPPGAMTGHS